MRAIEARLQATGKPGTGLFGRKNRWTSAPAIERWIHVTR